jgi:hypothetical protein
MTDEATTKIAEKTVGRKSATTSTATSWMPQNSKESFLNDGKTFHNTRMDGMFSSAFSLDANLFTWDMSQF